MKCMIAQNVISKFVSCLRTACVYFNIQCFFRCFPSCNRTDDAISVDFPSAQLYAVFSLLVACVSDGCKPTLFGYDSKSGETSERGRWRYCSACIHRAVVVLVRNIGYRYTKHCVEMLRLMILN